MQTRRSQFDRFCREILNLRFGPAARAARVARAMVLSFMVLYLSATPFAMFKMRGGVARGDEAGDQSILGRAELRVPRSGHTATALDDGRILILGGENESGAIADAEIFD